MDKTQFGIFGSMGGLKKDIPVVLLSSVFTPDNENVLLKDTKIIRRKMREKDLLTAGEVKVQTPDGNPIIHYHTFVKRSTGVEYLLAFTKAHIYHWNPSNKAFDVKFTCSSDCENWETKNYNDKIIATNNVDPVLVWDTTGYFVPLQNTVAKNITGASKANPCQITAVGHGYSTGNRVWIVSVGGMVELNNQHYLITSTGADTFTLDGINSTGYTTYTSGGTSTKWNGIEYETGVYLTKAKHLITYESYLILGYTYENGSYHPQRMRWNAIGEESNWLTGTKGSTEIGRSDIITGFGEYQGLLIVFKKYSYAKYWLVAISIADVPQVFNGSFISMEIGCLCSGSIVNDSKGRLYWYASDRTFKEFSVGTISGPIQTDIVDKIFQSSVEKIKSDFIDETEEVVWSIPVENALNNKLITFKEGVWLQLNLAIPAFGSYHEP